MFMYMHLWVWPLLALLGIALFVSCVADDRVSAMVASALDWLAQKLSADHKRGR